MPPYTRLKPCQRSEILGAIDAHEPLKDISNRLNVSYSTVKYTKRKRDERPEDQQDLPRQGRPQKMSNSSANRLYRRAKRDNTQTWDIFLQDQPIRRRRAYQRLLDIDPDFRKRRRRWRPCLKDIDARIRLDHEDEHRGWTEEDWANTWWSDECSVRVGTGEVRKWA